MEVLAQQHDRGVRVVVLREKRIFRVAVERELQDAHPRQTEPLLFFRGKLGTFVER